MEYIQTVLLGIVQGITELLPVSSSGHLLLLSNLIFKEEISTFFLTSLHLGTTVAILLSYKEFFLKIVQKRDLRTVLNLIIATIPAALAGVLLKDLIEESFRATGVIITMLMVVGLIMILVENIKLPSKQKITKVEDIKWWQALIIGFGQALALIPGTSRSGATTITGMLLGIEKFKALEYSFILGIPIMLGSFGYEMIATENSFRVLTQPLSIIGVIISALVGYLAIQFLKRFSKERFLTFFGIYRVILAILLMLLLV